MKTAKSLLSLAIACVVTAHTGLALAQASASNNAPATARATSQLGSVTGRVINQATGSLLQAATVRVLELNREVTTGRDGSFVLTNIPAGNYTLEVNYGGLDSQRLPMTITAGRSLRQDIRLTSARYGVEEMLVTGRAEGFASTINLQRNADSLRTVVSADALGQIREGNIGDALVRLPGLSVETRAGVQRTATIRGLAPQYNTVTVDGLRMTNVDGNRDIALDSFPANLLARVEVIKAPTPDMSADAIGGTVDLVTRSAYDRDGRTFDVQLGTTLNDIRDSWNKQAGITLGDTFGENRQFGLLGSVFYFRDERGYDVVDTAYTVSSADSFFINRSLYYDRDEMKDKVGAGLMFDYRPSDDTSAYIKAIYHYDFRELWRRGTDYRPNPATQFDVTPDAGSSTGGRVDSIVFYREPKNVFQMYTAGIEHRTGDWVLDGRLGYSKAKKDYPTTLQVVNSFNGVNLTYDRSDRDFPVFTVDNAVDLSNPSSVAFRQFDTNQVPRVEDELSVDVNALREFNTGRFPWSIKTGFRATIKDASQAQPDTVRYSGLTGVSAASLLEYYSNSDFMSESNGRAQLLPFFPDWRKYLELQQTNPSAFTQNAAAQLFSAETLANADFTIGEDILATYIMGTVDIDKLTLLGGVRVETTSIDSQANEVAVDNGQITDITRVSDSNEYTNVLPSLHLRYAAMDDQLIVRSSISKAISRPPPGDLIPSKQENAQLNQRIIGNPALEPAESINYDLTAEYFLPPLGVISAGAFYKDIDNFVFSSSRIASDGVDERTRINGDGGKVRGLEFVWSQDLTFLPGLLSGLGVEANYTWLDSEGVYPGRDDDLPLVNSPDYIINGILSYAQGPFSMRISMNKMPDRLESVGGREALDKYNAASTVWDLAFKYRVLDQHNIFFNVKNLTNEPTVQFQGSRDNPTSVVYYGTQYTLGVDLSF
ncbi:TonB-dependent receptor [Cellvibrio japonicus]|uniref:Putative TonB dependent receptor n=1 Tax=Cellvibrio japonicus (strain Ueda107) TaxID=498211 RepID=B3PE62_CELJU|nr:TonB-dependent receptor [Cellvibrio japonicus]ACE85804.1 putative TonB dependent receptor [Cellvibrio japonicus Ueda107]QEI12106.1 TonB-dependent receptor [Cellvibrio japonicus]QEI15680.1 TonB-dependent receptor [Cellvibrio japonicus]QEI19258.1 TonB-dependent receptor [Cellvibrio japonicus]